MRKHIIRSVQVLICFFIFNLGARCQITTPIVLHGKVTNQLNNPLFNVHIIDLTARNGTITDREGIYRLLVYANDTVHFTSMGFKAVLLIVPGITQGILQRNVQLLSDTINLTEYIIRPYPKDLQSLRQEFLALDLPEETPLNLYLEEVEIQGPVDAGMVIKGPFTALYEAVSRHAKIMRRYENLIRQDNLKLVAGKRYNLATVRKITGLKDDKEVMAFMEYCSIDPNFVLSVNDYDLFCAIKECYRRFMNQRN
jgi:hypothetical protein